jgi:hypothetical protein
VIRTASVLADVISVNPNTTLPGTETISSILGGLVTWALYICAGAIVVGGGAWAFGQRGGNFTSAHRGRDLVFGGFLGGLLAGAAQVLINFAFSTGQAVH